MRNIYCDCRGCSIDGECCALKPPAITQETLDKQSAYLESRLDLIEELFAQIFGMFPLGAAEAFATCYNQRRAGIILHFKPESEEAKQILAAEEKTRKKSKSSPVVVPSSSIILP